MIGLVARLDRLLGRVSMYLLVVAVLGVLTALAIVLALAGAIAIDPLAILVSALVLNAASWLANRVLGLLFRTRGVIESGTITAQLLLFVLDPTLDPVGLLGLAAAAAVAAASKYLLAWRGRHLVNPAAVAAVVVGVTGLAFSSWWVATPPLLPAVALGALLILWRTKRIGMGLAYLAVAGGVLVARYLSFGADAASSLSFTFLSFPVVFVA
ncbi:MAG: oxidoreductase, partial [Protaetiibacter sp.]